MGWVQLRATSLLQHRREILRAGPSLANTDCYGQPDADGYRNRNCDTGSYSYRYAYERTQCYTYDYSYAYS